METTAQRKQKARDAKNAKVKYVPSQFLSKANQKWAKRVEYLKKKTVAGEYQAVNDSLLKK